MSWRQSPFTGKRRTYILFTLLPFPSSILILPFKFFESLLFFLIPFFFPIFPPYLCTSLIPSLWSWVSVHHSLSYRFSHLSWDALILKLTPCLTGYVYELLSPGGILPQLAKVQLGTSVFYTSISSEKQCWRDYALIPGMWQTQLLNSFALC